MQNPIQQFSQSSIVFKKPGILSENSKLWLISSTSESVSVQCFWCSQTAKSLISFCRRIGETIL